MNMNIDKKYNKIYKMKCMLPCDVRMEAFERKLVFWS